MSVIPAGQPRSRYRSAGRASEPPLTESARHLAEEFAQQRRERRPDYRKDSRTLTILRYCLGAGTAVCERALSTLLPGSMRTGRPSPVCQFLRGRSLLVGDPELHRNADLVWINTGGR
ncbi:hypothetical protein M2283_009875 [Streptomyces pseudovenezuelae]|uniref:Uncharacterized protein n=1 Tax=Streptomyces pseudovenezuelae TaxID=67350 RepID=A0ABT6M4F7_9ACTN|nr:hypothetical protein [Streptomyces pseudovenezuelae]